MEKKSWIVYVSVALQEVEGVRLSVTHSYNQSCISQLLPKVYETEPVTITSKYGVQNKMGNYKTSHTVQATTYVYINLY